MTAKEIYEKSDFNLFNLEWAHDAIMCSGFKLYTNKGMDPL